VKNASGRIQAECFDNLFVKAMRFGVEACGRSGDEAMTQVSAGDEGDGPFDLFDCTPDTSSEMYVIVVGKKAVPERDDAAAPAAAQEKVERYRCAVIEVA
jgi:hypothetical protein